jgi:hypothetical protein
MTIIAERGLFVRLLVQSGKFETSAAEALVDALDAATREPATKGDLNATEAAVKAEVVLLRSDLTVSERNLKTEIALLSQRMDLMEKRLDARIASVLDKLVVRLGGLMIALIGLLFAALRLT